MNPARLWLTLVACAVLPACGGEPPLVERGRVIASERGCLSCHSVDASESVGPTWKGLYLSEVELSDGTRVTADEDYLAESIRSPSAKTVAGYPEGLMETVIKPGAISEEEIRALIAYITSLR